MRKIVGPVVAVVLATGVYFGLKARYGDYAHYTYVKVDLPRAGQLVHAGTDVRERGIVIGSVSDIQLVDDHAQLTLRIEEPHHVPHDAQAVIDLKTLLGDKYVDLQSSTYGAPWLENDATIQGTIGPELQSVVRSGTDIFKSINGNDLGTVVGNLAQGAQGHGMDVRQGFEANAQLSGIFAKTLKPQLRGLDDFAVIFGALKDKGVDLNRLADAVNVGVPVYASARAHRLLDRALVAVAPFADNLADLLINQKPFWDRMIDGGDKVLGTIAARPGGLHDLLSGLYVYVQRLGGKPPLMKDGSAEAPFTNFMGGTDFQDQVATLCHAIPGQLAQQVPICTQARYAR
jgi:phospholipid/cholesterol/gamma-HCH transport system substrate-binding protein